MEDIRYDLSTNLNIKSTIRDNLKQQQKQIEHDKLLIEEHTKSVIRNAEKQRDDFLKEADLQQSVLSELETQLDHQDDIKVPGIAKFKPNKFTSLGTYGVNEVFLELTDAGSLQGRINIELFDETAPWSARIFRDLCVQDVATPLSPRATSFDVALYDPFVRIINSDGTQSTGFQDTKVRLFKKTPLCSYIYLCKISEMFPETEKSESQWIEPGMLHMVRFDNSENVFIGIATSKYKHFDDATVAIFGKVSGKGTELLLRLVSEHGRESGKKGNVHISKCGKIRKCRKRTDSLSYVDM